MQRFDCIVYVFLLQISASQHLCFTYGTSYKCILIVFDHLSNGASEPLNGKNRHFNEMVSIRTEATTKHESQYLRQPLSKFLQIRYYPRS